jgi:hypothetical protein
MAPAVVAGVAVTADKMQARPVLQEGSTLAHALCGTIPYTHRSGCGHDLPRPS